jgi:hypothetical protein
MKLFPHLLLYPNIPKPLHGLAPRTILGNSWWNKTKAVAKARMNDHCWTCGVHKSKAEYHKWIEAHECYSINYSTGCVEYVGTSALCHACHNYIHDGRMLSLVTKGEMPGGKYRDIINHGNRLIHDWLGSKVTLKTPMFPSLLSDELLELASSHSNKLKWIPGDCEWEDYHLIIDGIRYERKFETFESWKQFYNNPG